MKNGCDCDCDNENGDEDDRGGAGGAWNLWGLGHVLGCIIETNLGTGIVL